MTSAEKRAVIKAFRPLFRANKRFYSAWFQGDTLVVEFDETCAARPHPCSRA
jgi:hypothetical protein